MLYLAKVEDEEGETIVEDTFETLSDAVLFCNENADKESTCNVLEAYMLLTGVEEHLTIMEWANPPQTWS